MRTDKQKAIKLRQSGKSYNQITKLLGIPKSTLSTWLKDLPLTSEASAKIISQGNFIAIKKLIKRNKQQSEIAKARHKDIKNKAKNEAVKFLKDPLFIAGISLYWAEGYKKGWNKSNWKSIDFTNSDPDMIKLMMNFFKKFLKINKNVIFNGETHEILQTKTLQN